MGTLQKLFVGMILVGAVAGCGLTDSAAPAPTATATRVPVTATSLPSTATPTSTTPTATSPAATATRIALPTITGTQAPIARLVSVGKYSLYLSCTGSGFPTVVMDSGLGAGSSEWSFIAPKIAANTAGSLPPVGTRVCVYDRANTGRSDKASTPRTSQDLVDDLHTLLSNAGVAGPYVLVGHSLGGLNARLFASEYPESVVSMVLVDAAHEDLWNRLLSLIPAASADEPPEFKAYRGSLNAAQGNERIDLKVSGEQVRALRKAALRQAQGTPIGQTQGAGAQFGAMPLIVLSHGKPIAGIPPLYATIVESIWSDMQLDLLSLSTNSKQIIATQSGHDIPSDQPQLVIDAAREVVRVLRAGG